MAGAAAHNEQVEDFVASEVLMSVVEDGQLQRVDYAADGVNDSSGEKPAECRRGHGV